MRRIAVFIATTDGPVQIQRISRERTPLSMVILGSGSERLPISDRYDDFARSGSGPVERFFGPFPEGGFRLEVSGAINSGESWQLGVFIAHAVQASDGFLLARGDPETENGADHIIWMTGQVDYDGKVSEVNHIQEKIYASRTALTNWMAQGVTVSLVIPAGENQQRLLASELPKGINVIGANDAIVLCRELGVDTNSGMPSTRTPPYPAPSQKSLVTRKKILSFGAALITALLVALIIYHPFGDVRTWPERLRALIAGQTGHPPKQTQSSMLKSLAELPRSGTTQIPKSTDQLLPAEKVVKISLRERRAPSGKNCADVHFGNTAAVERVVKKDTNGQPEASQADGLCGLLLIIDAGQKPRYLRADVKVVTGRLIGANRPPEPLSGRRPTSGQLQWSLDLPDRIIVPVQYRITLRISEKALTANAYQAEHYTTKLEHTISAD